MSSTVDAAWCRLPTLLKCGSTVVVRGKLAEDRTAEQVKAAVRWCIGKADGTFRAGLEFLDSTIAIHPDPLDCYEVLQLRPNADAATISRVYRILASRFHPDNTETGNSEKFIRVCEAHQILRNPETRARYDERHRDVFAETSVSTRTEEDCPPSVGALRGWNTILRFPGYRS